MDLESRQRLGPDRIGEIWISGPNVAAGYWRNAEATDATFQARIEGGPNGSWLRTGDLGFMDSAGELFITGRIKDVLIVRGMNHYPQDIEATVQAAHISLRRHCGAAFMVQDASGREKIAVVQEVERTFRHQIDPGEIEGMIREAVINEHEIAVDHIVLTLPSSVPKTTSGKVQRGLTRRLWLEGLLPGLS